MLEFDKDTYVATESDGSVRIVVERHGSTQRAGELPLEPAQQLGGAGHGLRRHRPGHRDRFPPAPSTATLTIPLVSDAIVENTEVFLVEIEPAQSGVTLGERSHAAVIVVDDD